jgi:hypothetical protein
VINSAKGNICQRVFTDEFHVSFHKPKEDSCDGFRNLSNLTENNRINFQCMKENSKQARQKE